MYERGRGTLGAALLFLWVWPVLAATASGCSGNARRADCDALIGVVNDEVTKVRAAKHKLQESESPSDGENLATTLENAAHIVEAVSISDGKLLGYRRDYRDLLKREARDRRNLVAARRAHEKDRVPKLKEDLKKAAAEEQKLVDAVNAYCPK